MKIKALLALALLISFSSCKDKTGEEKTNPEVNQPKKFTVEINIVATLDDAMTLYYTVDNSIDFTEDFAVWSETKGNTNANSVVFSIKDEEIVPTNIRLDFGRKKEQRQVTLNYINFSFGEKQFKIKGSDFFNYFIKNETIDAVIDNAAGTITFKQKGDGFSVASFYTIPTIQEELAKLEK